MNATLHAASAVLTNPRRTPMPDASPGLMGLAERGLLPDWLVRIGIRRLIADGLRERDRGGLDGRSAHFRELLAELDAAPIAVQTEAANDQHYELPPEFFSLFLGSRRKYSGCLWHDGVTSLDAAEEASLAETCAHADLADGQRILELGCGWGSLTLWMAERYPHSTITAVSNSAPQRRFIEGQCAARGFVNVRVITADMNSFAPDGRFDRVVSVEMFEHMRNHRALLRRIADWLDVGGKLFVHIFVHGRTAYLYEDRGLSDWITRYFFSGGMMPSDDLLLRRQGDLVLEEQWRQSGVHYARTAEAWLQNLDRRRTKALAILAHAYGAPAATRWLHRWRIFFIACAELFGFAGGAEWWVSHYRFQRRP
ncbi:MAG: hypothetical protein AMXMBFR47_42890 [Planctomycetota bacterium]